MGKKPGDVRTEPITKKRLHELEQRCIRLRGDLADLFRDLSYRPVREKTRQPLGEFAFNTKGLAEMYQTVTRFIDELDEQEN